MERRYPHSPGSFPDEPLDALAHFPGGFVGEGNGQNLAGPRLSRGQKARNATGQHARFARSRAGNNQQGGASIGHCCLLLGVQSIDENRGQVRHVGPSLEPPTDTFASLER